MTADNIIVEVNQAQKKYKVIEKQISILSNLNELTYSVINIDSEDKNLSIYKLDDISSEIKDLKNISATPYLIEINKLLNYIKIIDRNISDNRLKNILNETFKRLPQIEVFIQKKIQYVIDLMQKNGLSIETMQGKKQFAVGLRESIEGSKIMSYSKINDIINFIKSDFNSFRKEIKNETVTEKNINEVLRSLNILQKPLKDQMKRTETLDILDEFSNKINSMPKDEYEQYPDLIENYLEKIKPKINVLVNKINDNQLDIKEFQKIYSDTSEVIKKLSNVSSEFVKVINSFVDRNNDSNILEKVKNLKFKKKKEEDLQVFIKDAGSKQVLAKVMDIGSIKPKPKSENKSENKTEKKIRDTTNKKMTKKQNINLEEQQKIKNLLLKN